MNNSIETDIYRDVRSGTNILGQKQFKETVMAISDVATEMVVQTLGPGGATTVIDDGVNVFATKDGLHSLESLFFSDPVYNTIYRVLRATSFNSAHKVGDGSTTAMVVSNKFMHDLNDLQTTEPFKSMPQAKLISIITEIAEKLKERIKNSPDVERIDNDDTYAGVYKVAYIASNGDEQVSRIIQEIYKETKNPNIHVTEDSGSSISYDIIKGYRFNCRPLNLKKFANTEDGYFRITDDPVSIYIFDHNVVFTDHKFILTAIINKANSENKMAIILSPHFDDITASIINTQNDRRLGAQLPPNLIMIQIPMVTELNRAALEDLAVITNCNIFDSARARIFRALNAKEKGIEIQADFEDTINETDDYNYVNASDVIYACCGTVQTFELMNDSALIRDYTKIANSSVLNAHILSIKKEYDDASKKAEIQSNSLLPEFMAAQEKLNRITGCIGVIKVGGKNALEKECMKDTLDDAVFACKSAYENGIIRGLNLTTLKCILDMHNEYANSNDVNVRKIYSQLSTSFYVSFFEASLAVMGNMGIPFDIPGETAGGETANRILAKCITEDCTYDLRKMEYEEKGNWTVINAVTTDIEIIDSAVSLLSRLMTSTQLLTRNRQFDKGMTRTMAKENELQLLRETETVKARAMVDVLIENGFHPALFGGNSVGLKDGESCEVEKKVEFYTYGEEDSGTNEEDQDNE